MKALFPRLSAPRQNVIPAKAGSAFISAKPNIQGFTVAGL
ncbi:hypothetical protein ABIE09_002467 [Lysobacter enzymogenes]